ncbi:hypothetical protein KCP78_12455 [Salmonella enterica subsp. enterica]|nr:hypothetical protein KCP78_12455 [Salmonella enterica subsp. enterica]
MFNGLSIRWMAPPSFIKRLPHFAALFAVRIKGRTSVAVVYDPMRNELFTATQSGATERLPSARRTARDLERHYRRLTFKAKQYATTTINIYRQAVRAAPRFPPHRFRRAGSGLCEKQVTVVDGFFEWRLRPWFRRPGELLIREAGGIVSDFTCGGRQLHLMTGNIVAGIRASLKPCWRICARRTEEAMR